MCGTIKGHRGREEKKVPTKVTKLGFDIMRDPNKQIAGILSNHKTTHNEPQGQRLLLGELLLINQKKDLCVQATHSGPC